MIAEVLFFISIAWVVSLLCASLIIITNDDAAEVEDSVVFLFPANLIFIIKYWWKAIVKAIKS